MNGRWPTKTLAEACQIKPPKSEARDKLTETDLVSFLPMEAMGIDQMLVNPAQEKPLGEVAGSYTYFAEGDVLLAKITPCFENGKLGIASGLKNGIGFGSSEYIVFRPNHSISKEWLYYFLLRESFRIEGAERMSGAVGHKRVSKEFIEDCRIPAPPLAEQQRLVSILHEAFAGIATAKANAEKNLQNARELFTSYLEKVFALNDGSHQVTLSEIATHITDGDHMPPPKASEGIPFITISNINKHTREIDFSDTFKVPEVYFRNLKISRKPKNGDILYTVTGSYGIPVRVPANVTFCFQRHIGLIRPKVGVNSAWLYYALLSPSVLKQATDGATGTAQKTVSLKVLRGIRLPKVSQAEQVLIAQKSETLWGKVQRLESIYQQKLKALSELKQSFLQKTFSGELTSDTVQ